MAYLVCTDLSVGYDGHPVAERISFTLSSRDMLCVIGQNGAGKSTLVKTLLGLTPPLSGTMALDEGIRPDEVGYLPQQGDTQRDFPASAREIVLSGRLARMGRRPFYGKDDRARADEALARVGAAHLAERPFAQLSGGQQQRVLLARVLCASARLIVLDEPTTGLDPEAAASLYELLDSLREQEGVALLVVTHDVDEALSHASHVLSIENGSATYRAMEHDADEAGDEL